MTSLLSSAKSIKQTFRILSGILIATALIVVMAPFLVNEPDAHARLGLIGGIAGLVLGGCGMLWLEALCSSPDDDMAIMY